MRGGGTDTAKNSHCTFNDVEFEHVEDYNATSKPSLCGEFDLYKHVRLMSHISKGCSHCGSPDELASSLNARCT